MATLILYPESKIQNQQKKALMSSTAVVFLPLRHLQASDLTVANKATLKTAQVLFISSWFALSRYIKAISKLTTPREICVLSQKMADTLATQFDGIIRVADKENQVSLAQLRERYVATDRLVWLIGDLTKIQHEMRTNEASVIVYDNRWSEGDQLRAEQIINGYHFEAVLVTSPSAFKRLQQLMLSKPTAFTNARFYTLGQHTYDVVRTQTKAVWAPSTKVGVLNQALTKIIADLN